MTAARGRGAPFPALVLPLILAVALALRLAIVRFGLPALDDPDELMFEVGALRMLRGATLDPGWFGHPATTVMYALALLDAGAFGVAHLLGRAPTAKAFGELAYADPSWIILPGRVAAVAVSIGVIWAAWRLGRRLFGDRAGLAAAALLALDPVHLAWSPVIRADMAACLFLLLCLVACVDVAERAGPRDYARAAAWLGLAVASKWPFALGALGIAGATASAVRARAATPAQGLGRLLAAGALAAGTLVLVSPFLLIDHATVVRNLQGEGQARHLGATGDGFWPDLLWYLRGPLLGGFGAVGMLLLAVGAAALARDRRGRATLAPVGLGFLVTLAAQPLIWERWSLPLLAIGAVVAGLGVDRIAAATARLGPRVPAIAGTLATVAALVPLAARAPGDARARMTDTRQLATAWARAHVPRGRTVLVEHYAFDMVGDGWRILFPIGEAGCVDALALLRGRVDPAAIEAARAGRSNVDWGTMAPAKRAACRPDVAVLAQMDRYRAERARFPAEWAAYETLAARASGVTTIAPIPGRVGGPVVTILTFGADGDDDGEKLR